MGVITLTERVSVSVRAKSNTGGTGGGGASAQELATGRNAAKALGADPESISDEEAEALFDILNGGDGTGSSGASSSGTSKAITDEQGRQWLPISGIIAAGKRMYENGAFDEKKNYTYGNVACVPLTSLGSIKLAYYTAGNPNQPVYYGPVGSNDSGLVYMRGYNNIGWVHNINDDTYKLLNDGTSGSRGIITIGGGASVNEYGETQGWIGGTAAATSPAGGSVPVTDVGVTLGSISAYGDYHEQTTGGSLIDWTKPDDEIEDDIRNLHDTWDVTEHEGSVTANGTYILAGPIEFNDADPVG